MTDSDTQAVTWKTWPGASRYKAADVGGRIWSDISGRELTPKRTGTSRYWQVKYTGDDGKQHMRPVGVLVLLAHRGEPKPGQQCCHGDDNPDNNDLSNLRWDWPPANVADRMRNNPAKPKPLKVCVRCNAGFEGNGRRCHPCVVEIGVLAAKLLRSGVTLERSAAQLEYPSLDGLHTLARRHGGYGLSWSQSVRARLKAWLAGGDAR